ncbi:alpha/beta fold hydrolase [Oscillatoriales cyanobacterium LEGE 11467]|uniref:Alpha/beta fold hydrolase n=1 Tax=Zarconia navalis LEGE 11467 TaxID=1828826 RepID=A0A928Z7J6_9CYAN|nr:alpha/beta fold hydrolase [Zarconia navalis]MBE9039758.1 alpha/beta fold hydrolase [Zarconia navalis LEGE 11467]
MVLNQFPSRLGSQRDWAWRGWQIRYTFIRSRNPKNNAPPILLLHGFGASLGQWRSNLQALSENHTVYALDFLGFGASQKAPERYNVCLWSNLVKDFWANFIQQPAAIVGHSLGALVALTAVSDRPQMASHLALLTLPDAQPNQAPAFARSLERLFASPILLAPFFRFVRRPQLLRSVLRKIYLRPELVDDELVNLFSTPPRDRGALDVFCRLARSRSEPEDYSAKSMKEMLPALTLPVLLIWGTEDRIVPLAGFCKLLGIRDLTGLPDNCKFVAVENAGHCAYDECPEKVNRALIDWILAN